MSCPDYCPACGGDGYTDDAPACPACKGTGRSGAPLRPGISAVELRALPRERRAQLRACPSCRRYFGTRVVLRHARACTARERHEVRP